jgi:hypothetical protein
MLRNTLVAITAATSVVLPAIALSAQSAVAGEDVGFTLTNGTTYTLAEFYASPTQIGNWENDILGTDSLPPGGQVYININDGRDVCNYDVLGVFSDGTSSTNYGIDFCSLDGGNYTFVE